MGRKNFFRSFIPGRQKPKALLEHSPSYISFLPTEILAQIFEIGRPLHEGPGGSYDSNYPFILASVCRYWRNVATRLTPLIWNSTSIFIWQHDLNIPLLHIERSGELPLNISFFVGDIHATSPDSEVNNTYENLFNGITLLHGQLYRLETLKLESKLGSHELSTIVDSLHDARAPKLRTLSISGKWPTFRPIFVDNGAPNLSSLALYHMGFLDLQPSFSSITKLELHYCGKLISNADFACFLTSFRLLQQLKLKSSGPDEFGIQRDRIFLPNLLALELGTVFDTLRLSSLQTPSLHTLKIPAPPSYMHRTSHASFVSRRLKKLPIETLIIWRTFEISARVQTLVPTFLNVKNLVFHETGSIVIVKLLRSMSQESHLWQSIETLSITPWINEAYGPCIEDFVNGEQSATWKPLKKIRLGTSTRSPMPVKLQDAFKALAMRVEILPLSFDLTDISNFVGKSECEQGFYFYE